MEIEIDKPLTTSVKESEKSSNFQVAVNIFKSALGLGLLALPYCFLQGGVLLSSLFMFIMMFLTIYTVYAVVDLAEIKGLKETDFNQLYIDYVGKKATIFFHVCMGINYFGVGITYVIFFIDFFENSFETKGLLYSLLYSVISLSIIIPLSLIRKLEFFSRYSFLANILSILVLIIIVQYPLRNFENGGSPKFGNIVEIPSLLGVALFAFVSPGLIIPMRNSMRNKNDFKPTFLIVEIVVLIIYIAFPVICCYGFIESQITENILKGFGEINNFYLVAQGFYAVALVLTYPMQITPLIQVLENIQKIKEFMQNNNQSWFCRNIVRVLISLFIFPFGILISKFAAFINLLGALCFFIIQFVYPLWAYNVCHKETIKTGRKIFNYCVVLVSIVAIVASSYNSIKKLIED